MASKTPVVSVDEGEEAHTVGSPPVYHDATGQLDLNVNGLNAESKIGGTQSFLCKRESRLIYS
jgi:hypothetical protein